MVAPLNRFTYKKNTKTINQSDFGRFQTYSSIALVCTKHICFYNLANRRHGWVSHMHISKRTKIDCEHYASSAPLRRTERQLFVALLGLILSYYIVCVRSENYSVQKWENMLKLEHNVIMHWSIGALHTSSQRRAGLLLRFIICRWYSCRSVRLVSQPSLGLLIFNVNREGEGTFCINVAVFTGRGKFFLYVLIRLNIYEAFFSSRVHVSPHFFFSSWAADE